MPEMNNVNVGKIKISWSEIGGNNQGELVKDVKKGYSFFLNNQPCDFQTFSRRKI